MSSPAILPPDEDDPALSVAPPIRFVPKRPAIQQLEAAFKLSRAVPAFVLSAASFFGVTAEYGLDSQGELDLDDEQRRWWQNEIAKLVECVPQPLAPHSIKEHVLTEAVEKRIAGLVDLIYDPMYTVHDVKVIVNSVMQQTIREAVALASVMDRR